jgi:hypothetical protein
VKQRTLIACAMNIALMLATPAAAQPCRLLCTPSIKVEPTVTVSNLFKRHRVINDDGVTETATRGRDFEMIIAVDIPTRLPRLAFTFEAIWTPFGRTSRNPFTGKSASELGVATIRDNPVELEFEINLKWLRSEQTGGWVSSHFDIVDKYSPAERPADRGVYTHKLNLELDTAVAIFRWLPETNWLHRIELEGSLDYMVTGLPRAGDRIGTERFLTDASPWSLSFVLVIPITPG